MKLCVLFSVILNLSVAAAGNAQEMRVTLELKNAGLNQIIEELKLQTGLNFFYSIEKVNKEQKRDVKIKDIELDKALASIFNGTSLTYTIMEDVVVVKDASRTTAPMPVEKRTIKGVVKDKSGVTLPGVSILIKGTQSGVATDINGHYEIKVDDNPNMTLLFSFVGMVTKEVKIGQQTELNVTLESNAENLEEVIVTGYQTISKERATGSFGTISGKDIEVKLQPNLKSLLEGQATGVVLNKEGKIEIRGISTFNAVREPLIVVDGFPIEGTLESVNPENIASITVLKDGVAASIYGSRAANGVIVIATTRGQKESFRVSYKGIVSTTLSPSLSKLNKASSSDYIDAELALFNENPNGPSTTDKEPMGRVTWLMMQVREGNMSGSEAMGEINELRKVDGLKQAEKHIFRSQFSHQHNLSISGGNEKNSFNAAINYLSAEKSMIHSDNSRLILDLKNDWSPSKYLSLGVMANVVYTTEQDPVSGYRDLLDYSKYAMIQPYDNLIDPTTGRPTDIFSTSPYKIATYQNTPGMKSWIYNPIEELGKERVTREDLQLRIGGNLRVNIIDGLNIEAGGVWNRGNVLTKNVSDRDSYRVRIGYNDATSRSNNATHYLPDGAIVDEQRNINESWTLRTQVNFNRAFNGDKHRVTLLAGNEIRQNKYDNNTLATRVGYNSTAGSFVPVNAMDLNAQKYDADMLFGRTNFYTLNTGSYSYQDVRFVSWYGNASYEYDSRFILSGSVRLDLTNFFGTDPKYRYKPLWSVGGTYKLSEEKFFNVDWIDRLNIRASYGINGNISLSEGPFLILSVGKYSYYTEGISYGVASPPNNQLRWEKTSSTNIGTDIALLDNRINLSLDYYYKNSSDLLARDANDPTSGFSTVTRNVGRMTNSGIELSLSADVIRNDRFAWRSAFNLSYNTNKVKEYNVTRLYAGDYMGPNMLVEGKPADALYAYRFAHLNDKGDAMAYRADGSVGSISDLSPEDVVYSGTTRPKYDLAWTNTFKYKDIQLSFMFIAKLGHKYRKDCFHGVNYTNRHVSERWMKPGDEATKIYPKLSEWSLDMWSFPLSDIFVGNANYMKLRDVTLSYDLPKQWIQTIGLSDTKVYFQARNLFTVTAKGVDIDPETAELGEDPFSDYAFTSLPLRPEFYFGLSFSF